MASACHRGPGPPGSPCGPQPLWGRRGLSSTLSHWTIAQRFPSKCAEVSGHSSTLGGRRQLTQCPTPSREGGHSHLPHLGGGAAGPPVAVPAMGWFPHTWLVSTRGVQGIRPGGRDLPWEAPVSSSVQLTGHSHEGRPLGQPFGVCWSRLATRGRRLPGGGVTGHSLSTGGPGRAPTLAASLLGSREQQQHQVGGKSSPGMADGPASHGPGPPWGPPARCTPLRGLSLLWLSGEGSAARAVGVGPRS